MRALLSVAAKEIRVWRTRPRVWAAFLLGMCFCLTTTEKYIDFSEAIGSSIQVTESYIIIGSSTSYFTGILLGVLLLLSDAPFVNSRSRYEIIRIGKATWSRSQILYITLSIIIYLLTMVLFTMLIVSFSDRGAWANAWSRSMEILACDNPYFAVTEYKLTFPYPSMISEVRPYLASILTLIYNMLYCLFLCMCMYVFNLVAEKKIGLFLAIIIHFSGYVIIANGMLTSGLQRFSPLSCAFFANQFIESTRINALNATLIFLVLLCVLTYVLNNRVNDIDI